MFLRPALLTEVVLSDLILIFRYAHADVVLPDRAGIARNKCALVGLVVVATDAADDILLVSFFFFLLLDLLGGGGLLRLLRGSALGGGLRVWSR
jgi:hypothetical protein